MPRAHAAAASKSASYWDNNIYNYSSRYMSASDGASRQSESDLQGIYLPKPKVPQHEA